MRLYTVKQTSKILGFSTNTIYKFVGDGTIKSVRGGKRGRFRIPQSAIEEYLGNKLPKREDLLPKKDSPSASEPLTPPLALTAIRLLLIITLLVLIADIFLNPNTPFLTQILRLIVISIFILLAYQFGGIKK